MCILLSLVFLGPCGIGAKVRNKWNNKLSKTILCYVPHTIPLVWMVLDSNHFLCNPGKLHNQCTMYTAYVRTYWAYFHFHYLQLSFHHPFFSDTCPFYRILSLSDFIHPINHYCWLDGLCASYQISLPCCSWVTNTNPGHIW